MIPTNSTTLNVRRFIAAPRARVFAAFTNPDDYAQWIGPGPCKCVRLKLDAHTGGKFEVRMKTFDGSEVDLRGEYLEVRAPERLVFTWQWIGEDWDKTVSQVTVDFFELDGGTDVQLTHERLPSATSRDHHAQGWSGSFDKLVAFCVPDAKAPSDDAPSAAPTLGEFCWNELITPDVAASGKFYTQLFGWTTAPFPGGAHYTLFKQGDEMVGGMMALPRPEAPPSWVGYVSVADCDASAARAVQLGAKLCMEPMDIPGVGRIAVFKDPQGVALGIHQPEAH